MKQKKQSRLRLLRNAMRLMGWDYKHLNPKTLSIREQRYLDMCVYMMKELKLGFVPRWFVQFHYKNPDDKNRADNTPVSESNKVKKYRSLTKLSFLKETRYDNWMGYRYSDIDWIYRDTNAINRRLHRDLFGIKNLNSPRYTRPNLYYFHERGKYGKYREDKEYHTHLLLPEIPNYGLMDLKYYFNYKPSFRCLKCLSDSRDFYIEDLKSEKGSTRYLNKEELSSPFSGIYLSLDPHNSFTLQRKDDQS